MTRRLAVVGNGIAAAAMLDWLVRLEAGWDITVFGDEAHPAYDRAALSGVLSGERSAGDLWLHGEEWYRQHGIEVRAGCRVLGLATATNTLRTERGDVGFDACVLATGSRPVVPPIGGTELSGVTTFRTLDHVRRLARAPAGRAVVIGGGLLGLEAARGLLARGHRVTVVHLMDRLMERQLDHGAAGFLRRELERIGIRVLLGARTERIEGWRRAESVVLAGGARLPADLVVICAGVSPDLDLAAAAGLKVCRGILVDDRLATSAPEVFAVGECAEHRGVVHGLVAPVREQALALARGLAGDREAAFTPGVTSARLRVAGVNVFAAGRTLPEPADREVLLRDDVAGN
ncbi:MAG TPA: FAD-dependent oxidoreductase, partial [Candidatus Eisenbacteria bacterium]|nr:FAD-dependent oxidoreductase [Candidatus Eisenbacteria bacterium]